MIDKLFDNTNQSGLLALAPFFLLVSGLQSGLSFSLLAFSLLFLLALIVFPLRNLIPLEQGLIIILVISVSVVSIASMLLNAEAYAMSEKLGLFLPLLVMNSLFLSVNERLFSIAGLKSALVYILSIAAVILLFFSVFGFLRDVLADLSIFSSAAGCFFLTGFLFAIVNFFKGLKDNNKGA